MKIRKITLFIIIISIILICIPKEVYAWLQYSTYEACNNINVSISWLLKIVALIIAISYIQQVIKYLKYSEQEKKQKVKNVLTWLIVVIVQVIFFIAGALWVKEIGIETYWSTGERFQFNDIDEYISNGIRIIALITIILYIIMSIIYFIRSKQDKIRKIENVIRWQIIMTAIVIGLLVLATNW